MTEKTYKFTATKVVQPIGDFFVAKIPYDILTKCVRADIRRITDKTENISGIQREKTQNRVKEIYEYVKTIDSSFPNSVILNLNREYSQIINVKDIELDNDIENIYIFSIKINKNTFDIIDGQHRLAGLELLVKNNFHTKFDVITTFYRELPVQDQAYLFSTINGKQNKVNQSLVMDLFEESEYYTPEKCAHIVTKLLNSEDHSALYKRISLLGKAPKFNNDLLYKTVLTQGTVARKITRLISKNTIADRDLVLRNETISVSEEDIYNGLIFREFYSRKEDWAIFKVMNNFFSAVKTSFSEEWEIQNSPLSKTIGYNALISFLVQLFKIGYRNKKLSQEFFQNMLNETRKNYELDKENKLEFGIYQAAGSGERKLYKNLMKWTNLE